MLEPLSHLTQMPVHQALYEYLCDLAPERYNPEVTKQLKAALGGAALADTSLDIVCTPVAAHDEADPRRPLRDTTTYRGCRTYAELPDAPPAIILGLNRPPNADERAINHTYDAINMAKRDFGHKLPWLIPIDMGEYPSDESRIGQLRAHNIHGTMAILEEQSGNPESEEKLSRLIFHNRDIDGNWLSPGFFPTMRRARAERDPTGLKVVTSRLRHTASGLPNIDKLIYMYDLMIELHEDEAGQAALNDCSSAFGLLSYMGRNGIGDDMKSEIHEFLDRGDSDPLVVKGAVSEQSPRRLVEKLQKGTISFWEDDFGQTESYRTTFVDCDLSDERYAAMNIEFLKRLEGWQAYFMKLHFGAVAEQCRGIGGDEKERAIAMEVAQWRQSIVNMTARMDEKGIAYYDLDRRLHAHLAGTAFNDRAALSYLKPR